MKRKKSGGPETNGPKGKSYRATPPVRPESPAQDGRSSSAISKWLNILLPLALVVMLAGVFLYQSFAPRLLYKRHVTRGKAALEEHRYGDAVDELHAAIYIMKDYESEHPEENIWNKFRPARVTFYLAGAYVGQGRFAEADKVFKKLFSRMVGRFPRDHPEVAKVLAYWGNIQAHQGRYDSADELYQEAIAVFVRQPGPEKIWLITALSQYSQMLKETERSKDAERVDARLRALRRSISPGKE